MGDMADMVNDDSPDPMMEPLKMRQMPKQKPGLSKQNYATPDDFIAAVKVRFRIKEFSYDLAAETENTKARHFFCEEEDSLKQDWKKGIGGSLWLNPPFSHIEPWAEKCKTTIGRGDGRLRRIFFLTPASVGANWFRDHVDGAMAGFSGGLPWSAYVKCLFLNGRLSFDGKDPYPKDTMLTVYGAGPLGNGYEVWDWRKK